MTVLRLFPLHTVLFPRMPLALQVFEDRYRALVAECLAAGEPFGVVLIRAGAEVGGGAEPFLVGTTAAIEGGRQLADGRLAVAARGGRRFRITRLLHDRVYPAAEIDYPVDEVSAVPEALYAEVGQRYAQLRRLRCTIAGGWVRSERPLPAAALADAIGAAGAGIVEPARLQPLLESLDVRRRLERAAELLTILLEATHPRAQQAVALRWGGPERGN